MSEPKLTPRKARAVQALLQHQRISRERLDREIGASNSPDTIGKLRHKHGGADFILCDLVTKKDRDGRTVKAGVYRLAEPGGEAWARELLQRHALQRTGDV